MRPPFCAAFWVFVQVLGVFVVFCWASNLRGFASTCPTPETHPAFMICNVWITAVERIPIKNPEVDSSNRLLGIEKREGSKVTACEVQCLFIRGSTGSQERKGRRFPVLEFRGNREILNSVNVDYIYGIRQDFGWAIPEVPRFECRMANVSVIHDKHTYPRSSSIDSSESIQSRHRRIFVGRICEFLQFGVMLLHPFFMLAKNELLQESDAKDKEREYYEEGVIYFLIVGALFCF
jgi:hypothetical protein